MVQIRNIPPTREEWQQQQRQESQNDKVSLAYRAGPPTHDRLLTVTQAVRDCAGIPVQHYALIAILENGDTRVFSSNQQARIVTEPVVRELQRAAGIVPEGQQPSSLHISLQYDSDRLTSTPVPRQGAWTANPHHADVSFGSQYPSGSDSRRRRHPGHVKAEDDDEEDQPRKRSRGRNDSHSPRAVVRRTAGTQDLRIGDMASVTDFLTTRLRDFQQTGCKELAKIMIKLVEPKKQTHHPYTKGADFAPEYWPPTTGDKGVRHVEPDHLHKPERLTLIVHIICLLAQPAHKRLACFNKENSLTIKKIEDAIMDKMNDFFNKPEAPKNKEKRKYLKDFFKVAKKLEQFNNGEIDGSTYVTIMLRQDSPRNMAGYVSSDDEGSDTEADEETVRHQQRRLLPPAPNLMLQTQPSYLAPVQHQPQFEVGPMYEQPRTFESHNSASVESSRRSYGSPAYSQGSPAYAWTASPTAIGTGSPNTFYTTTPQMVGPPTSYSMASGPSMTTLPPLQNNMENTPRFDINSMNVPVETLRQENMMGHGLPQVNTSFADTMFTPGQYPTANNEHVYQPQHPQH